MKKTLTMILGTSTVFATFAFAFVLVMPVMATTPDWDTTGDYTVDMEYLGSDYSHDVSLEQDEAGNLTGSGGSPAGDNTYYWTITDGIVIGDSIEFTADYTATVDATDPQTTIEVEGSIATDGTISGTWSDNYQGVERSGAWTTTSGEASEIDESSMVNVTIEKFIDGNLATAVSANDSDFPMESTWDAANMNSNSGSYQLSETNDVPYQVITSEMTKGADYSTKEMVNGAVVGAQCSDEKPFALHGYTTGDTRAEAMDNEPSMTEPSFFNLQNDKYVIVWNHDCSEDTDQINGDVVAEEVDLEVTSIEMVDTTATANGSFADGWEYVFRITAPMSEQNLSMKFDNWLEAGGNGMIPVTNNMRISSDQADNNSATIMLTAEDTYSTPNLFMTEDLDLELEGRQVEIRVEVSVPNGTPTGSYSTSYGVQSNP